MNNCVIESRSTRVMISQRGRRPQPIEFGFGQAVEKREPDAAGLSLESRFVINSDAGRPLKS